MDVKEAADVINLGVLEMKSFDKFSSDSFDYRRLLYL